MPRQPRVNDSDLCVIARFLSDPNVSTEIQAEMKDNKVEGFSSEYKTATNGYEISRADIRRPPFWKLPMRSNKRGVELRIYIDLDVPMSLPSIVRDLSADHGAWYRRPDSYRINHYNLVMQLFECGFLLGANRHNKDRIDKFIEDQLPNCAKTP